MIDERSYKGSITSEAAIDTMVTFDGHLDMPLMHEFRNFTLDKG